MTIIAGLLYRVSPYSDYNWCLGQHCFWLFRQGTAGRLTSEPWLAMAKVMKPQSIPINTEETASKTL